MTAAVSGHAPARILHVVAPCDVGGLEEVVRLLAIGQHEAGHDVHVAAVTWPGGPPGGLETLSGAGVSFHPLVLPARAYLRERAAVAALCRRISPSVVHTHGYRPDVVDAGVARQLGVPLVTTAHGFTGGGWRNRLYEWLQRRAFRRFDAVVAVSAVLGRGLTAAGVPSGRVHVVPNAWRRGSPPLERPAARAALGIPEAGFRIGWVGRVSFEKGADVLLDALLRLRDLPVQASVLGNGILRATLERRAAGLGLADRVTWHGVVPGAARLFAAFDVFVLSSRTEGTPMVLFEAMAAGVPVVATSVGGVPDVVTAREAALVPPNDAVALAAEVRAVLRDPRAAAQRAARAAARLEADYRVEPWVRRYDEVYAAAGVRGAGREERHGVMPAAHAGAA